MKQTFSKCWHWQRILAGSKMSWYQQSLTSRAENGEGREFSQTLEKCNVIFEWQLLETYREKVITFYFQKFSIHSLYHASCILCILQTGKLRQNEIFTFS